jgi:NAD(P)-dependent dehydrogenase (short-subunit alcohol dehydrogenase family)
VGLGKETAVKLASLGAKVIMLCKTPSRAEAAVQEVRLRSGGGGGGGDVSWLQLDLGDLRSVERCADQLKQTVGRIDILCNNAGK